MSDVDSIRHRGNSPLPPIDESVVIPESVRRAAALAESFYKKDAAPVTPPAPDAATVTPPIADAAPVTPPAPDAAPVTTPVADVAPVTPPAPDAAPVTPPTPVSDADVPPDQWEHRYRSMKGRYDAQLQINAQMQENMQQLGDELVRTQQMLMSPQRQSAPQQTRQPATLITAEDQQNYGNDLIDLTKRAALEAVAPQLSALENENRQLTQRLQHQSQLSVAQTLDEKVPTWREVNRDPAFKRWLSLRDIYSGVVRKQMLDAAYQAADAPRVVAFFKGFVDDEAVAAGTVSPALPPEQHVAPRTAAVPLENLAAPGRARPAGGNDAPNVPADKPIFTRKQISGFYDDVRRGVYAGREPEKSAREREIFAAQSDGRVR